MNSGANAMLVRYTFYTYTPPSQPPRDAMTFLPSHTHHDATAPPRIKKSSPRFQPRYLPMTSPIQQTPPQSITRGPTSPPETASPAPHPSIISAPSQPLTGSPFTSQVLMQHARFGFFFLSMTGQGCEVRGQGPGRVGRIRA